MTPVSAAPLWAHIPIARELIKREVQARYRGTFGGVIWYILNNLAILAIYTVVFSLVLKVRWPGGEAGVGGFALRLFAGLIVFNLAAETINRAPQLIIQNPNYVKKIVFPLEILPVVLIGASLTNALVAFAVLIGAILALGGAMHWTIALAPLVVVALLPWLLGVSWFLASFGVYVRDIGQLVPLVTTAMMFLSPIFYPPSALPERLRRIVIFNPLSAPINAARDLVIDGVMPNPAPLLVLFALGALVAWLGLKWFRLTQRGFADVL